MNSYIEEINQKYGINKPSKRPVLLKAKFDALDQDFKKLLHRDAKFATIYKNEENYERKRLGNKYLNKKLRMSIEDREFEVYKKYANWVLVLTTDPYMVKVKENSTHRTSPSQRKKN